MVMTHEDGHYRVAALAKISSTSFDFETNQVRLSLHIPSPRIAAIQIRRTFLLDSSPRPHTPILTSPAFFPHFPSQTEHWTITNLHDGPITYTFYADSQGAHDSCRVKPASGRLDAGSTLSGYALTPRTARASSRSPPLCELCNEIYSPFHSVGSHWRAHEALFAILRLLVVELDSNQVLPFLS